MWCTPKVWEHFARRLESLGFEVWAPAMSKPTDPNALGQVSVRDYIQSIDSWLESQNFSVPPILMGHSLGGIVAQKIAEKHKLSAMVLLAPVPPRGINLIYPAGLRTTFNILLSPKFWERPTRLGWSAARWGLLNEVSEKRAHEIYAGLVPGSGTVYREIAFWFLSRDHVTKVDTESVMAPVLVAGGDLDHIIPVSVVRKVAKLYSGSEFIEYPKAGHWLIEEPETEDLIERINEWLFRVVPGMNQRGAAVAS